MPLGIFALISALGKLSDARAERDQAIANEIMWLEQVTLVSEAHAKNTKEINRALLRERKLARAAESRAEAAISEVERISDDECFDSPVSDTVITGLCDTAKAMSPTGSVQNPTSITGGDGSFPPTTYRDVVQYAVQVAERLQRCNGQLTAIGELYNEQ